LSTLIKKPNQSYLVWVAVSAAFILCVYRLFILFQSPIPLQVDEAQYLDWSRSLAAGYYSKPPLIAWIIAGNNVICSGLGISQIEGCARLGQPFAILAASLSITATTWLVSKSILATAWTCFIASTLPFFGFYSLFATTDAWLLMFWSIALYLFVLALQESKWQIIYWALGGAAVGFGLLTKYSMAALLLSGLTWMIINRRIVSLGPWLATSISILMFSPNILWNISNGFPTWNHHAEIAQISADSQTPSSLSVHFSSVFEFIASQVVVAGPHLVFFMGVQVLNYRNYLLPIYGDFPEKRKLILSLLFLATWIIIGLAVIQAFSSRAFANWAAPAYLSACTCLAVWLSDQSLKSRMQRVLRKCLVLATLSGLTLSLTLIHLPGVAYYSGGILGYKIRAVEKLRGWKDLALWIREETAVNDWVVASSDRRVLAAVAAYGYPVVGQVFSWNPALQSNSHYHWFYSFQRQEFGAGQRFIVIQIHDKDNVNNSYTELHPDIVCRPSCDSSQRYKFVKEITAPLNINLDGLGGGTERVRVSEFVIL
jgi:4-amino-4-deoxy-L-arabinose transferase-like glycosyltransferase